MSEQGMQLFEHGLRDIYDAEHRFVDALQTMMRRVDDEALAGVFQRHLDVTREQVRRLEDVFEAIDERPRREKCSGAEGLVREYETFVRKEKSRGAHLDLFATDAGLKVEHYEMVAYNGLVDLAERLGYREAATMLRQNLREEQEAAAELEKASRKLAGQLVGGSGDGLISRAAETLREGAREGAFAAVGIADTFRERTGEALDEAETRGRQIMKRRRSSGGRSSPARGRKTTRRRATAASSGKTSSRAKKTSAKRSRRPVPAKSRSKAGTRSTARRPARRTTRSTTRRARAGGSRRG
jgi:ferritin-like metal-binding protein YciE